MNLTRFIVGISEILKRYTLNIDLCNKIRGVLELNCNKTRGVLRKNCNKTRGVCVFPLLGGKPQNPLPAWSLCDAGERADGRALHNINVLKQNKKHSCESSASTEISKFQKANVRIETITPKSQSTYHSFCP